MPPTAHANLLLRCHHCGREVSETSHSRSSYRVDYYVLYTGEVEPIIMSRSAEASPAVRVLKLVRASEIVTCVDCYRLPEVRAEREGLFRPELQQESHQQSAIGSQSRALSDAGT